MLFSFSSRARYFLNSEPLSVRTFLISYGKSPMIRKKKLAKVFEECERGAIAKVVLVKISLAVSIYILRPFLCFSTVSRARTCPGYLGIKSFGFLKTFWRLVFLTLPK